MLVQARGCPVIDNGQNHQNYLATRGEIPAKDRFDRAQEE